MQDKYTFSIEGSGSLSEDLMEESKQELGAKVH
jgi:hypothetical protein